jgi:hypothetical protein
MAGKMVSQRGAWQQWGQQWRGGARDGFGWGDPNPESGNSNLGSGNPNPSEKEDRLGEELTRMDVSMVFMILAEFHAPTKNVVELALGAERAVFEKPENPGAHMKPLFI